MQAPKGDIFADYSEGKLVVSFDAKEVLAYLEQLVPVMLSIENQRVLTENNHETE